MDKQSQKTFGLSFYSCLTLISILCGMSILGFCVSAGFSSFIGYRFLIPWYSLGMPPEPAEKIVNVSPFSIEVVSLSGKRYTFQPDAYVLAKKLQGNWVEDNSFITKDPQEPICKFNPKYTSLPKHLKTIDYAAVAWCPEIIVNIQYAILEDGSVWRWNTAPNPSSLIPTSWWLGGGIGFLIGLSLVIRKAVMELDRKEQPDSPNAPNTAF